MKGEKTFHQELNFNTNYSTIQVCKVTLKRPKMSLYNQNTQQSRHRYFLKLINVICLSTLWLIRKTAKFLPKYKTVMSNLATHT